MGAVELGGLRDNAYRTLADDGSIRIDCQGRMKTGDLGFLDDEGYLHLTGRAKDVIIRGGVNISPMEIDAVLMQRPEIVEACTVGVPDKKYGEEVVSYVVLRAGAALGVADILRHCAATLPAFKAPKQIVLSEELPKTERGKLDRKVLVERWARTGAS
jgi:acyl-CoA synthetase (AMP-forming)/AMP-acid ligase II